MKRGYTRIPDPAPADERARLPGVRRVVFGLLFLTIFAGVLVGGHSYLARRLVIEPGWAEPWRTLALGGIVALALSLIAEPIAQRTLSRRIHRLIAWPASLWMGFGFLLLLTLCKRKRPSSSCDPPNVFVQFSVRGFTRANKA